MSLPPTPVIYPGRVRREWHLQWDDLDEPRLTEVRMEMARWAWEWYQQGYTRLYWWRDPHDFDCFRNVWIECRLPA